MHKFDHDYCDVLRYFGLPSIKSIHCVNDITFLYKLLVGNNINGELLKLFEFKHYTYYFTDRSANLRSIIVNSTVPSTVRPLGCVDRGTL